MSSTIERAKHALFSPEQSVGNIKFFLGNKRNITDEELVEQLNRAEAQVRSKAVIPSKRLDGELETQKIF